MNGHADGVNGHAGNGITGPAVDGVSGHAQSGGQAKPALRLSFPEYRRISNLLVLHLRRAEEGACRWTTKCFNIVHLFCLLSVIGPNTPPPPLVFVLQLRRRTS